MRFLRLLMILFVLTGFAGEADAKKINWEGMRQIKVGMTTSDVVKLVGKPLSITAVNGKLYYGWASYHMFGGGVAVVSIEFTDGKVTVAPVVPEELK